MKLYCSVLILLTSVFFSRLALCQEIFDGFIISADNNYKYGSIQINTSTQHELCSFKPSGKSEFRKYTPDDIEGYGIINGQRYITKAITENSSSKKVFLKNESNGAVKLYSFNSSRFFLEKDGFIELRITNDSGTFKEVLSSAMQDCKNIKSSIRSTSLTLSSLKKLFLKYQRCTTGKTASEPNVRIQTDVLAGLEINTTSALFNNTTFASMNDKKLIDRTLLCAGANVSFTFKNNTRLSYVIGAFYYQQNFYAIQRTAGQPYSYVDKLNFNYNEIVIPTAVRYSFLKREKNIMPYIKGGITIPFTLKSNLTWDNETEDDNSVYYKRYDLPQKYHQTFQIGISIGTTFSLIGNIKNVIEVGYQQTGGSFKSAQNISINSHRITILLGLRF